MKSRSNNDQFYQQLAPVYHLKVDWKNRSGKEDPLFAYLIDSLKPSSVLDIGCGDGGHASRFASAGIRYHGLDSSSAMIEAAVKSHSSLSGVTFSVGDMAKLPKLFSGQFDQVVMLGNTLPHLLTRQKLKATLTGISRSLINSGYFVLQTVNSGTFTGKEIRFLPPKLTTEVLFAPFYSKRGEFWDFYMPIYRLTNGVVSSSNITSTSLKFWTKKEIVAQAQSLGLKLTAAFGNAKLDPYRTATSDNMILIFRKLTNARTARG